MSRLPSRIERKTKLGSITQTLVGKMDDEINSNRYRETSVKDAADGLTVAEVRQVASELDTEPDRLRTMQERINQLKEKLKEVVGV